MIISVVIAIIALMAISIAYRQLAQINLSIKRSFSPILVVVPSSLALETIHFSSRIQNFPVVEYVRFELLNDGNGPAFNINFNVFQGSLELQRGVDPLWSTSNVSLQEANCNSLTRGERFHCFFRAGGGFTPPAEEQPLLIRISCENIFGKIGTFTYTAPTDVFSAISEDSQTFLFLRIEGF